ncbi:MAG: hypothetical protein HKO87_06205 [Acidimicrobiia bacterium]|nr:hypothetical protein [Acidimicrobiia bacterium]NNK92007.1 hypothetical protein [Acidimicrobiia bacterium]
MAVAVHPQQSIALDVSQAAASIFARSGDLVAEIPVGRILGSVTGEMLSVRAVAVADARHVEVVADGDFDPVRTCVHQLVADGWSVTVLVDLARLGEAHGELRRTGCTIQPWWEADEEIVFGAVETP